MSGSTHGAIERELELHDGRRVGFRVDDLAIRLILQNEGRFDGVELKAAAVLWAMMISYAVADPARPRPLLPDALTLVATGDTAPIREMLSAMRAAVSARFLRPNDPPAEA